MTTIEAFDAETRDLLDRYGFDVARFAELQARVASGALSPASNVVQGTVEPPDEAQIVRMPLPGDAGYEEARALGSAALERGEVAMAVLNGGMATRFGGVVKGTVAAVDGRSFLEWKLAEAARVAEAAGAPIPAVIMNSFATDEATKAFLAALGERAPDPGGIRHFTQFISLRMNTDGSLFRDDAGRPSPYAPGHGDFNEALRASGTLAWLRGRGVRLLHLSNVDNLGARLDPVLVGMHRRSGAAITNEVAAKAPGDAGGAPARVDGRTIMLESPRFPTDFDQDQIRVFNTNSFLFDLEALDAIYPLAWFYVEKEVDGRPAVQLERFVNELSSFLPTAYLQVPRTGPRGRFFPIKSRDDLAAAQPALRAMLATSLTG